MKNLFVVLCAVTMLPLVLTAMDQKEKDYIEMLQKAAAECKVLAKDRAKRFAEAKEFSVNRREHTVNEIIEEARLCEENTKTLRAFLAQLAKKYIVTK